MLGLFDHNCPIRVYTYQQISTLIGKLANLEVRQDSVKTFLTKPLIKSGIYHNYSICAINFKAIVDKLEEFWRIFSNKKKSQSIECDWNLWYLYENLQEAVAAVSEHSSRQTTHLSSILWNADENLLKIPECLKKLEKSRSLKLFVITK